MCWPISWLYWCLFHFALKIYLHLALAWEPQGTSSFGGCPFLNRIPNFDSFCQSFSSSKNSYCEWSIKNGVASTSQVANLPPLLAQGVGNFYLVRTLLPCQQMSRQADCLELSAGVQPCDYSGHGRGEQRNDKEQSKQKRWVPRRRGGGG